MDASTKNETIVCTAVKITERNLSVIYKYFQVYFKKMTKKLTMFHGDRLAWEDLNDNHYSKRSCEDFPFTCEFVIEIKENDNNTFKLCCNLFLNNGRFHTFIIDRDDVTEFTYHLEGLEKEFRICKCGSLCEGNKDQCKKCWIYDYEHEEDCSICMENNYIWEKLECGHCFHKHCLNKLTKPKCPLCRNEYNPHVRRTMM